MKKEEKIKKLEQRRERLKNRFIQEVVNKSGEIQFEIREIEDEIKELQKNA